MNHVMLDLETMATTTDAAVIAIGAVSFDPMSGEIGSEFYRAIDISSSAKYGKVEPETIRWWMGQSESARAVFFEKDQVTLRTGLEHFAEFLAQLGDTKVQMWGNGIGFDNVILANAYRSVGMEIPWKFRDDRDVRTLVALGEQIANISPKKQLVMNGVAHHALDDARFQARYICEIYRVLKVGKC